MYKSPIDVLQKQIRLQYENDILKAVQEHAVHVDKEELLKALQYDREQYEKGFADGTRAIARILERLQAYEDAICNERLLIGNDIYKDKEELQRARNLLLQELAYNNAIGIIKEEVG